MNKQKFEKILNKLKKTTDSLGIKIDKKVLEAVAVFNYLGFSTTQSCEGHLDHGYISPWIQFGPAQNKTNIALERKIAKLNKQPHNNKAYKKIELLEKRLLSTLKKDLARLTNLLENFYKTRKVPYDQKLILIDLRTRFQLITQGSQFQNIFSKKEKTEKIEMYRKEFDEFVRFVFQQSSSTLT